MHVNQLFDQHVILGSFFLILIHVFWVLVVFSTCENCLLILLGLCILVCMPLPVCQCLRWCTDHGTIYKWNIFHKHIFFFLHYLWFHNHNCFPHSHTHPPTHPPTLQQKLEIPKVIVMLGTLIKRIFSQIEHPKVILKLWTLIKRKFGCLLVGNQVLLFFLDEHFENREHFFLVLLYEYW